MRANYISYVYGTSVYSGTSASYATTGSYAGTEVVSTGTLQGTLPGSQSSYVLAATGSNSSLGTIAFAGSAAIYNSGLPYLGTITYVYSGSYYSAGSYAGTAYVDVYGWFNGTSTGTRVELPITGTACSGTYVGTTCVYGTIFGAGTTGFGLSTDLRINVTGTGTYFCDFWGTYSVTPGTVPTAAVPPNKVIVYEPVEVYQPLPAVIYYPPPDRAPEISEV